MSTIEKPCIKKCTLNEEDICMGCFRTFEDMLKWHKSSVKEKEAMLFAARNRKNKHIKT